MAPMSRSKAARIAALHLFAPQALSALRRRAAPVP
jgi:hypothetical protein